jgi:predicted nuclease with TOPRIM domain
VNNNNDLIDRLQYAEVEKQRLKTNYGEKEAEVYYLTKELEKREIQNARMKALINQASSTITITEQDYSILQKQVEILTKKMQLLMIENQKLSSYYHRSNESTTVALNVSRSSVSPLRTSFIR